MEHSLVGALSHRRHTDHVVAGELATYQKVNLVRRKRKGFPAMSASDSLVSLQHGLVVPLEAWLLAIRCEEVGIKLVPRGDTLDADAIESRARGRASKIEAACVGDLEVHPGQSSLIRSVRAVSGAWAVAFSFGVAVELLEHSTRIRMADELLREIEESIKS